MIDSPRSLDSRFELDGFLLRLDVFEEHVADVMTQKAAHAAAVTHPGLVNPLKMELGKPTLYKIPPRKGPVENR